MWAGIALRYLGLPLACLLMGWLAGVRFEAKRWEAAEREEAAQSALVQTKAVEQANLKAMEAQQAREKIEEANHANENQIETLHRDFRLGLERMRLATARDRGAVSSTAGSACDVASAVGETARMVVPGVELDSGRIARLENAIRGAEEVNARLAACETWVREVSGKRTP